MTELRLRVERWSGVVTLVAAVLLGLFAMNAQPIGVFQDDGHYLLLARALAHGGGYHYTNLPGVPAAAHFPPGYPLLLAPLWWVAPQFPANVAVFKLLNVALLPVVAWGVRAYARRVADFSPVLASSVAVAVVATVPVLFLSGLLFSEIAFMAALLPTLACCERVVQRTNESPWPQALAVGGAIGALALLRTVGIALLPAVVALLLIRRRWRDAGLVSVGTLAMLLPWQVWSASHARDVSDAIAGGYGAYGTWLVDAYRHGGAAFFSQVLLTNLRGLLMPLTLFGLGGQPPIAQGAAVAAMLALLGVGVWQLRAKATVSLALLVPYGALLLAWPFPPDRFLWPLWPLLVICAVEGVRTLSHRERPPRQRAGAWLVATVLGALFLTWHARMWASRGWEDIAQANARVGVAVASVAAALPADGLVAADQDAMVALYANRQAVPLLALTAEQHVRVRTDGELSAQVGAVLDAYHPRWVLVAQQESLRAARLLATAGRLRMTGVDPSGVIVYDVVR